MENNIEVKKSTELTTAKYRGFEEPSEKEDLIIPRAKLLQALSPEVQEKGLQQGLIINNLTLEPLPSEFIPIFKFTQWIRFNPRNSKDDNFDANFEPGGVIYRTSDPHDSRLENDTKFGDDGTRPLTTKFLNFLSYFPGQNMPIVVSFCNTSLKAGRKLLSLAQFNRGDMFSRKYKLVSRQTKNDMGTFFVLDVDLVGSVSEEEMKVAEDWYNSLAQKTAQIQVHDVQEEWKE
jgi:hypothetical protein